MKMGRVENRKMTIKLKTYSLARKYIESNKYTFYE